MSQNTTRRWTADEVIKLKSLARKQRAADIAKELGRTVGATTVKAHALGLSLKVQREAQPSQSNGAE
jgi:hypothetical protein